MFFKTKDTKEEEEYQVNRKELDTYLKENFD